MIIKGKVWRYLPAGKEPFHAFHISNAEGRWNRPGQYGALYTAFTVRGALAEYIKAYLRSPSTYRLADHELVRIEIEVERVADLTQEDVKKAFLISTWTMTGESPPYEQCRRTADYAREHNYTGLKVPSAAVESEENFILYIDLEGAEWWGKEDDGTERRMVTPNLIKGYFPDRVLG